MIIDHKTALGFALAVTLLSGCNYERMKLVQSDQTPKTWYATLQVNTLAPKCMGCHNPTKLSGGLDFSDYDTLMATKKVIPGNGEGSPLFESVKLGRMPKSPNKLNTTELGSLKAWIDAGASPTAPLPEKPAPPVIVVPPPPLAANYKSIKRNIIDLRCIGCHSGAKPAGELNLSSYKQLTAKLGTITPNELLDSTFYQRLITDNLEFRMPLKKPKIPDAEIKVVAAWIENGALEKE